MDAPFMLLQLCLLSKKFLFLEMSLSLHSCNIKQSSIPVIKHTPVPAIDGIQMNSCADFVSTLYKSTGEQNNSAERNPCCTEI